MLDTQQIIQMLSSLAGIIALIIIATFLLKKFGRFNNKSNGDLTIISTLSLGTKEKLAVIEVSGEQLLLGITGQTIRTLHVLNTPIQPHQPGTLKRKKVVTP